MKKSCGSKSKIDKVCRGIACSASILDSDLIIAIKSKDSVILTSRVRVYVNKDGWSQIGLINNLELQANSKKPFAKLYATFPKDTGLSALAKKIVRTNSKSLEKVGAWILRGQS